MNAFSCGVRRELKYDINIIGVVPYIQFILSMKISTEINQEKKIRKYTFSGQFDFALLYKLLDDVYKNPQYDADMNILWDLAETDDINYLTAQQLYEMVTLVSWKWDNKSKKKSSPDHTPTG